mgnify:CR=1 FL=1
MSQFNTFLIPLSDSGTSQEQLNLFLCTYRALQVERVVFPAGWTFCVEWLDGTGAGSRGGSPFPFCRAVPKVDYREVLPPEMFARLAKLRECRKAIALADNVKPYVVMTDAQLAEFDETENPTKNFWIGKKHRGRTGLYTVEVIRIATFDVSAMEMNREKY